MKSIAELESDLRLAYFALDQAVAGRKAAEDAYVELESKYLDLMTERDGLKAKISSGTRVLVAPRYEEKAVCHFGDDSNWNNKHNATLIFDKTPEKVNA